MDERSNGEVDVGRRETLLTPATLYDHLASLPRHPDSSQSLIQESRFCRSMATLFPSSLSPPSVDLLFAWFADRRIHFDPRLELRTDLVDGQDHGWSVWARKEIEDEEMGECVKKVEDVSSSSTCPLLPSVQSAGSQRRQSSPIGPRLCLSRQQTSQFSPRRLTSSRCISCTRSSWERLRPGSATSSLSHGNASRSPCSGKSSRAMMERRLGVSLVGESCSGD